MQKIKLSQSQKKIILISSVVLLVFLIFLLFIYLPSMGKIRQIKSELSSTERQIQEIEAVIGKDGGSGEGIRLLKEKSQILNDKFPAKEKETIKLLTDLAKKSNINLISIKPESKQELLDEHNEKVRMGATTYQSILVVLEMKCVYRDLVKFAQDLKESFPAFVTFESLVIKKDTFGLGLVVILNLNLFFVS